MSTQSKALRMRRIFGADGRTLIVAMDHAAFMGPVPGLVHPGETIRQAVAGGADAVMTNLGTIRHHPEAFGKSGVILTLELDLDPEYAVERAVTMGVDSVKILAFTHTDNTEHLRRMRQLGLVCDRWAMPYQIEVIPGGWASPQKRDGKVLAESVRIAAEAGADYVKTFYSGDPETFRQVAEGCYVPVVILGGDKAEDPRELLATVAQAVDAGAAGAAMGRNIWSHPHPSAITAAVSAVIHGERDFDRALAPVMAAAMR